MLSNRNKGFTLLEVMVAVAVLGFVAVGSLRLSIAATKTLESLEVQSELLKRAKSLETSVLMGEKPGSGQEDGLEWEILPMSYPIMDGLWQVSFRQLEVTLKGCSITLFIP